MGSIRASISAGGALLGRNDYYAFGGRHPGGGPLDPNNRLKFNGKEEQVTGALGLLDYGARMYDPTLARWQNVDPLAEKYLDVSGYAFSGNNPVNLVDTDGRSYDDFTLGEDGEIEKTEDTDDAFDRLTASEASEILQINDQTILPQLAETGATSDYSASYAQGNPSDLASVFLFGADNSNAEWRFSRFDAGNGEQYAVGTVHRQGLAISPAQMGFDRMSEIAFIHSHPTPRNNTMEEYSSMGWRVYSRTEAEFLEYSYGTPKLSGGGDSENVAYNNLPSNSNYLTYFLPAIFIGSEEFSIRR